MRGTGADGLVGAMRPGNAGEQRGETLWPRVVTNQQWEELRLAARPMAARYPAEARV